MHISTPPEPRSRFPSHRRKPVIYKLFAGLALTPILVSPAFAAEDCAQAFKDTAAICKTNAITETEEAMALASNAMTALL
jgi:hypothetical protein